MAAVAGEESHIGIMANSERPNTLQAMVVIAGVRTGVGLLTGGGGTLVVMTAINSPQQIEGLTTSDFDFAADLGAKWGELVKQGHRLYEIGE